MAAGQPVVSVVGYPGGIHLDHIEHDPTRQPALPDLEFTPPDCPLCGEELDVDADGFNCPECRASWGRDGQRGTWDEDGEPRCRARRTWGSGLPDESCALSAGHDQMHTSGDGRWSDTHPRAIRADEAEGVEEV
jgi:hypothetical protein